MMSKLKSNPLELVPASQTFGASLSRHDAGAVISSSATAISFHNPASSTSKSSCSTTSAEHVTASYSASNSADKRNGESVSSDVANVASQVSNGASSIPATAITPPPSKQSAVLKSHISDHNPRAAVSRERNIQSQLATVHEDSIAEEESPLQVVAPNRRVLRRSLTNVPPPLDDFMMKDRSDEITPMIVAGQKTKVARNPQNAAHFRNAAKLTSLKHTADVITSDDDETHHDEKVLKVQRTSSSAPPAISSDKIKVCEQERSSVQTSEVPPPRTPPLPPHPPTPLMAAEDTKKLQKDLVQKQLVLESKRSSAPAAIRQPETPMLESVAHSLKDVPRTPELPAMIVGQQKCSKCIKFLHRIFKWKMCSESVDDLCELDSSTENACRPAGPTGI
jgi:hypothetical protein